MEAGLAMLSEVEPARAPQEVLLRDDFSDGLAADGDDPRWRLRSAGSFPTGDGLVSTGPDGLVVVPTATNPETGAPAFAAESEPLGNADHLRWATMANSVSSAGFPGFDVGAGSPLVITARLSVQGYGLEHHPYGDDLADPRRDLRVGAGLLVSVDMETGLVCDFIVTDGCVFAVYERLALPGTTHAAFSYAVPVTDRHPSDSHTLTIVYSGDACSVRWYVGASEVLAVDRLGHRALDAKFLKRDNERPEEPAVPRQTNFGIGLFTDQVWGQGFRLSVPGVEVLSGSPQSSRKDDEV
jgi:hypothetical protein